MKMIICRATQKQCNGKCSQSTPACLFGYDSYEFDQESRCYYVVDRHDGDLCRYGLRTLPEGPTHIKECVKYENHQN